MLTFTVDGTKHEFDDDKMTFAEGKAMEKAIGVPFKELGKRAKSGYLDAVQAFVFVAMKRSEPTLRFSDLDDRAIADFEFEGGVPDREDLEEMTLKQLRAVAVEHQVDVPKAAGQKAVIDLILAKLEAGGEPEAGEDGEPGPTEGGGSSSPAA